VPTDAKETKMTYATSAAEMHAAKMQTGTNYGYYGSYYDQPHLERSLEAGHILGGIKAYSRDSKRIRWTLNFKASGIEKYDGSTNLTE
jgi:hypothetical protein